MAININDNLKVQAPKPIDSRLQVQSLSDLTSINNKYLFMLVFVIDEEKTYQFKIGDGSDVSHWSDEITNPKLGGDIELNGNIYKNIDNNHEHLQMVSPVIISGSDDYGEGLIVNNSVRANNGFLSTGGTSWIANLNTMGSPMNFGNGLQGYDYEYNTAGNLPIYSSASVYGGLAVYDNIFFNGTSTEFYSNGYKLMGYTMSCTLTTATFSGDYNFTNLSLLSSPTDPSDATTKEYVDGMATNNIVAIANEYKSTVASTTPKYVGETIGLTFNDIVDGSVTLPNYTQKWLLCYAPQKFTLTGVTTFIKTKGDYTSTSFHGVAVYFMNYPTNQWEKIDEYTSYEAFRDDVVNDSFHTYPMVENVECEKGYYAVVFYLETDSLTTPPTFLNGQPYFSINQNKVLDIEGGLNLFNDISTSTIFQPSYDIADINTPTVERVWAVLNGDIH